MASINNVVNVTLLPEGQAIATDNMNVVAIMTSTQGGPISSANRYELYVDAASVAQDFGTDSDMASYANAFFATRPNAVNAGGVLVAGFWRGATEAVAATHGILTGAQFDPVSTLDDLQTVQNGTMNITIGGAVQNLTALDFRTAVDMAGVAAIIDTALASATVAYTDSRLVITVTATGATSTVDTFASDPGTGTYIGQILNLADGTGATKVNGVAAASLTAETQLQAITELKARVNIKGAMFIDAGIDAVRTGLAEWATANNVLLYDVFSNAANLEVSASNVVWQIKLAGHKNYRMLYSKSGNRKLAATYMARAHVVNFNSENSAMTMHLKELSVAAEDYTQTEITKAKNVGLDIYTTVKDVPIVLTSGANGFQDNQYNLIAFVDAVQVGQFNLLKLTATKVPQTNKGIAQIVDQAEKDCRRFVRAGVFAPGVWSSPDTFGDIETFNRSIEQLGFYVLSGLLRDQPQPDRQARKAPVLQIAVKNSGAIHSIEAVINFNI